LKILLLGNTGQLGWELNRTLLTLGELTALDFPQINMADPGSIKTIIREHKPNLIINATAYTDVDNAESEPEKAMAINATGPGVLAEEALKSCTALIHYSTDYVFDGSKGTPYIETDIPNPINTYGLSKLRGEQAIKQVGGAYLILRTAWVYSMRRPCFVTKVLEWARTQKVIRIVDDQISSPTWARMLAEATSQIITQGHGETVDYFKEKAGLYHLAGAGACSRYVWAKEIVMYGLNPIQQSQIFVEAAKSVEFSSPVVRPTNSSLTNNSFLETFGFRLPQWNTSLQLALK